MEAYRRIRAVLAGAFCVTLAAASAAAQGTITGIITGADSKAPLAGVQVIAVGTTSSALTGDDGRYRLNGIRAGTVDIQAFRVGYQPLKKSVTVVAAQSVTGDLEMAVSVVRLQEVVTTATGQQRKVEIGNSVSTLGDITRNVETSQIRSMGDMLTAKAPGVVVLPGTMTGGAPTVRIRGLSSISLTNAPIYVLDGVRYNSNNVSIANSSVSMLNALSPEEIESIEIVKGPSAATLYGTDASNGVIVITTRRGRAGTTRWSWFTETGQVQDRNPYQAMYMNWGKNSSGASVRCRIAIMNVPTTACTSDSLTSYLLLRDDKERTFVKDGWRNMYGMNVSGGNQAVRFFISAEADNEIGPIEMPGYEVDRFNAAKVEVLEEWMHPIAQAKLNFRTNLNATLSPKLDIAVNAGFARTDNRFPPSGAAFEAIYYVGMMNYGYKGPGPDKNLTDSKQTPLNEHFQYTPGDIMQRYRPQTVQRTTMSFNSNYRPFAWMQTDATLGFDLINRDNLDLCRRDACVPQGTQRQGYVSTRKNNNRNISFKLAGTATWDVRPWANLKTTVGTDYLNSMNDEAFARGDVLPPGGSRVQDASTRTAEATWPTATKTLGLFVQEVLSLNDRLFITAAVRSDQNSAFGTQFQSVAYPKASISWLASDESFFPKFSWLDQARLRFAYGASGVQPGRTDGLITFAAGSQNLQTRGQTTGTDVPGLAAAQTGNPDLKPETSSEKELGFELQMFGNRITTDYTYYDKRAKDALIQTPIAPSSGASDLSPLRNVGKTRNWGHELQVNARVLEHRLVGWDVTVNASHNNNEILDLGVDPTTGNPRVLSPGGTTRQIVGYPINSRWFRPYTYNDVNGDGIIQSVGEVIVAGGNADTAFRYIGYAFPRDIISINSGFDLLRGKLRVNMGFDHKGGFNLQDGGNNFQCNTAPYACRETMDRTAPLDWQARHVAKVFGSVDANNARQTSDRGYYQPGNFWKFREFSAAYTVPANWLRPIRAQEGSSIVFSMRNISTWTNYTGLDPEEHDQPNDTQSNFQSAGPSTYVTFRFNLKY